MTEKKDYYEVLGVDKKATDQDLKKAFRSLARKYHPDKNPDDEEAESRFKEVQEAYAILSNPEQRRQYDTFGHNRPGGDPFGGGFQGVNINFEDIFGDGLDSIFTQFFGGGRQRRREPKGSDLLVRHRITFEAMFNGSEEEATIESLVTCEPCMGSGAADSSSISRCSTCEGRGRITQTQRIGPFLQETVADCPNCSGSGRIIKHPCSSCKGDGRIRKERTIRFNVPAGVPEGTRLRMQGQGEPPANGIGTNGHLYIEISVDDHPWFERSDTDLLMALPVGFGDLVQGRKFSIPHLDGKNLDIVVRPSTRPGETIDIPGRGIARARGRGRGDVTVLIKLHVPKKISRSDLSVLESLSDVLNLPDDAVVDFIRSEADDRRNDRG